MCGFAGVLGNRSINESMLRHMAGTLQHRGPDDQGAWCDPGASIGIAHTRLSVLDLSAAGHQPMQSDSGRHVLAYNGEIYNNQELRQQLDNERCSAEWRGHSDTETLLAAIEAWGLDQALKKCNGMFSLALWDRKDRILSLARDRFGEKPLYYGWMKGTFLFGSELKAFKAYPGWEGRIDRRSLALYLRYNVVPAPWSIFEGISKLMPGHWLRISIDDKSYTTPVIQEYWSAISTATQASEQPFNGSDSEAVDKLDGLLRDAVSLRMLADVPVGAFLSGGADSSTIAALMQAESKHPVKTFSIGFHLPGYNEAVQAKKVASCLGTDHSELYVSPEDAMAVIPSLPEIYDEPFADSSQIPTFLVARMAREQVTVALSGDGADELFGGYNRYIWAPSVWSNTRHMPRFLRKAVSKAISAIPLRSWDNAFAALAPILPKRLRVRLPGDKLHKFARIVDCASPDDIYEELVSLCHPEDTVLGVSGHFSSTGIEVKKSITDFSQRMMLLDTIKYLPDDILVKLDRATMAVSLEGRVPFLDHRIVEFAWALPTQMKIRKGVSKWLLREVLYRYVPKEFMDQPKMGFGVPIGEWLRGPLKKWADDLLEATRISRQGYLDPAVVQSRWQDHLSGRGNWEHHLWGILMFQAWMERQEAFEPLESK